MKTFFLLVSPLLLAGACGGGCPFTKVATPVIAPATACLELEPLPTDGISAGGCVDPQLEIHNNCTSDLTLAAADAEDGTVQTVPAGGVLVDYLVNGDANDHGSADYTLSATLGSQALTITFKVSGGYL